MNTSQQMGGALGLETLATVAAYAAGIAGPRSEVSALTSGYHAAFLAGAGCVVLGAIIAATCSGSPRDAGRG